MRESGFDPDSPLVHRILVLTGELIGFPWNLSQHPSGFFTADQTLNILVPVENAATKGRTVIQWDKDDLVDMGLLKVDILALGMLSALRRCFDLVNGYRGEELTLATVLQEERPTSATISRADTLGVLQIESRAQMTMRHRLSADARCWHS